MEGPISPGEVNNLRSGPNVLYEHMRVVLALTDRAARDLLVDAGAGDRCQLRRRENDSANSPDVPVFGLFNRA